jgi:AcrR family transcriptional regulator
MSEPTRRPYRSTARAESARATRRRIREAGLELFLRYGYVATSVRAIAARAGVAEATVYLVFPSKGALLSEMIRVAIRGGEDDAPLAARSAWRRMLASPGAEIMPRFAAESARILARTAPIYAMAEAAAASAPELAQLRAAGFASQRAEYRNVVRAIARARGLRPGLTRARAADIMFAITNEATYLRLTVECGWTGRQYAKWLAATLEATL